MTEDIHIGKIIAQKLQEDGRTVKWLADKIEVAKSTVYKCLKRPSIDCARLMEISLAMDVNFFQIYSDALQAHFNKQ
jgi:lambda repressor-like predicted transcriptional regulator